MKVVVGGCLAACLLMGCGEKENDKEEEKNDTAEDSSLVVYGALAIDSSSELLQTAGSPESLKVSTRALWLSENEDCTDPVLIGTSGADEEPTDFAASPEIFEGSPPAGTYKCVIIKIADNFTLIPDAAAVAAFPDSCKADTEYDFDIYRAGNGDEFIDESGEVVEARGTVEAPVEDVFTLFISTGVTVDSEQTATNPEVIKVEKSDGTFATPGANQAVNLSGALTVPGESYFVTDGSDFVSGADGRCTLEGLLFSFVKK